MSHLFADLFSKVNKPNKPKESASSKKWTAGDSSPHLAAGTFFGLVGLIVAMSVSCFFVSNDTYATDYTYSIIYDDNVVSNMPSDVNSGQATGGQLNIASNTPTRSGYKFLGWCNTLPSSSDGTDVCSGTTYQPSAGITIASATNFHLYAMWGEMTMQAFGSSDCSTMATGTIMTLKDVRDGEEYLIGKLADGKCWMLDNLRLDPTAVDLDALQGKTNASDQTLTYLKNGGGSSPYTGTAVGSIWSSVYDRPIVEAGYKNNTATSHGNGSGKIGVYYNFCAASAGSYCYASGQPNSDPDTSTFRDAKEDLCPIGWHIPTSGYGGSEYVALLGYYGNAGFKTALSTTLSGGMQYGSQGYVETFGWFWSSTYRNAKGIWITRADASSAYVNSFDSERFQGMSIRCTTN